MAAITGMRRLSVVIMSSCQSSNQSSHSWLLIGLSIMSPEKMTNSTLSRAAMVLTARRAVRLLRESPPVAIRISRGWSSRVRKRKGSEKRPSLSTTVR